MATYYVDGALGNDTNAGTSEGAGNAWATIDKAMNTVTGTDVVHVKASATYGETATIDTAGSQAGGIRFEGYTSTPGDGGQATIDGASTRANCLATTLASNTNTYYVFKNFIFTGATGDGVSLGNCRSVAFKNCIAHSNGGEGFLCNNSACTFFLCTAYSNGNAATEYGFHVGVSGALVACQAYSNYSGGILAAGVAHIAVLAYNNGQSGTSGYNIRDSGATSVVVANCTIDGNSVNNQTGIDLNGSVRSLVCVNNIIYGCDGTSGVGMSWGAAIGQLAVSENNLVNGNTTNYSNAQTNSGEVTSAPQFTTEGSDYSLQSGSPAVDAGVDAGDL